MGYLPQPLPKPCLLSPPSAVIGESKHFSARSFDRGEPGTEKITHFEEMGKNTRGNGRLVMRSSKAPRRSKTPFEMSMVP
jgi:hypothetical protein